MYLYSLEYQEKKRLLKKLKKQAKKLYYYQYILMLLVEMVNGKMQQVGLVGLLKMLVISQNN
jgi:hypothetical protein